MSSSTLAIAGSTWSQTRKPCASNRSSAASLRSSVSPRISGPPPATGNDSRHPSPSSRPTIQIVSGTAPGKRAAISRPTRAQYAGPGSCFGPYNE